MTPSQRSMLALAIMSLGMWGCQSPSMTLGTPQYPLQYSGMTDELTIDPADKQPTHTLTLLLELPQPRGEAVRGWGNPVLTTAKLTGEDGRVIDAAPGAGTMGGATAAQPADGAAPRFHLLHPSMKWPLKVPCTLTWQGERAVRVAELQGYVPILLSGGDAKTLSLALNGSSGEVEIAPGFTAWVEPATGREPPMIRLYLLHFRRASPQWHGWNEIYKTVRVVDADEQLMRLRPAAATDDQGMPMVVIRVPVRPNSPEPARVLVDIPLDGEQVRIPFALTNVPVP